MNEGRKQVLPKGALLNLKRIYTLIDLELSAQAPHILIKLLIPWMLSTIGNFIW
jgi:hypothetical protein